VTEAWITESPINAADVLARVGSASHGAAVLFLGTVRDHNEGRAVEGLEYEIYPSMAERVLAEILKAAASRWPQARFAAVHRSGSLGIGEVSVAVAVSTPHRVDAFDAARHVMEEVKSRLPVWKQEHYAAGSTRWLDGRTPPVPGQARGHDG
jgi:molybdopterin synthase catalytic subunit